MSKDAANSKVKGQIAMLLLVVAIGLGVTGANTWRHDDLGLSDSPHSHSTAEAELGGAGFSLLLAVILIAGA